jgi:hypothetical protein
MPHQRRAVHLRTCPIRPLPDKKQICGHALNTTSGISLKKVVGAAPGLAHMHKGAETSLRKSDRLGDRAAVHFVSDHSCLIR